MANITRIIHALLFTPSPEGAWGAPGLLWGPPGSAKTSLISQVARASGLVVERLSPGERGEGQFGVVPVPGADGFLHYPAPEWAARLNKGGVIFLDEINTAPPALQAPMLGLVQLRTLGAHTFGSRVRILAAANETQDAAGGWDLAPAIANRFCHIDFAGVDSNTWAQGLIGGFSRDQPAASPEVALAEEARVMAGWDTALARSRGLVAAFIQRRSDLMHVQPKNFDSQASKAWPSRRTWEYVTYALAGAQIHGLDAEDTHALVTGLVGASAASELAVWTVAIDLPDPAALLDGQTTWAHTPERLDRSLAVLSACAALVVPTSAAKREARADVLWTIIANIIQLAPDVVIPAAMALCTRGVNLSHTPRANAVLQQLHPILAAAGALKA